MTTNILDAMNPQQREAITAGFGPVLVVAGPGSGKTRVLTHRIVYLIQECSYPAHHIMAVTFTNRAAREMRERIALLIGEESHRLALGTFHSICTRILRREAEHTAFTRDFVIYDSQDQLALMKKLLIEQDLDQKKHQPWTILNQISAAKNELITPDKFPVTKYNEQIAQRLYELYEKRLRESDARDFDDLLMHTVWLFRNHPDILERHQHYFSYILVDEFQDTNMAQYELIKLLAGEQKNLFAVGDPDQSIYAFRGADYRNVKRFQADFSPAMIVLEENYRSHQLILDAAMAVIRKNPDHIKRDLFSSRQSGPKIIIHEAYSERDEAQYVLDKIVELTATRKYKKGDFAIMYRLNAQSRVFEETFIRQGMPYLLVGALNFYGRKEIKDALAFLRVINNPLDRISLERIINVPPRGIGDKTIEQFFAWADTFSDGPWGAFQALAHGETSPLSGRSRKVITPFAEMIVRLRNETVERTPLETLDAILEETGYLSYLQQDRTDKGEERITNVGELRRVANEYPSYLLAEFLSELSLVSDVDNLRNKDSSDVPVFLTLHAAKGLEFPVVFIVGMEDGILPHNRALNDDKQMAEERRLMYVGLTRARDEVNLVYTFRRVMWGYHDMNTPSRFLGDIPPNITVGAAHIPQPKIDQPYYQSRWETNWKSKVRLQGEKPESVDMKFKKGQFVRHSKFGKGIVINSNGDSGIEIVNVLFLEFGEKRLDASFLQPDDET